MGDFLEWAVAAEDGAGEFTTAYYKNQDDLVLTSLEASPVARTIMDMMGYIDQDGRNEWTGSATELLDDLNIHMQDEETRRSRAWPKSATWLSNTLRRLGSPLREVGIDIRMPDQTEDRTVAITIYRKINEIAELPPAAPLYTADKLPELPNCPESDTAMQQIRQFSTPVEKVSNPLLDDSKWPATFSEK